MRVSVFFYDVPKNASKKVKFFREFYGVKQKVNGRSYGGDGFLVENRIKSYKPGKGAIMISTNYKRKVLAYLNQNKIKHEFFDMSLSNRYYAGLVHNG
tara:strand:- start:25 stop:318 length:294 start_codon:yes stop_codon:yes gene_type:complete